MSQDLRFPIGQFNREDTTTRSERIAIIANLPVAIASAVDGLNESQFDTPYRTEGWTVRQTVHHVADSHSNSLTRFKLALTEDESPTIRPYYEERWAELGDSKLPVDVSLRMIDSIHARWVALLESMTDDDFNRSFVHPETGPWKLDEALALYAWHSKHHTAHITALRDREGW